MSTEHKDDKGFIQNLRERIRKRIKRLPVKEAVALSITLVKALADHKISGAEWDAIEEKWEDFKKAMEGAEVLSS